jgi:hypothetical protein
MAEGVQPPRAEVSPEAEASAQGPRRLDLVERLRDRAYSFKFPDPLVAEAADEIERLRASLDELRSAADQADAEYCAEIARLRLTDAEREAVEAASRIIDRYEEDMDGFPSGAAATLRGLLERLRFGAVEGCETVSPDIPSVYPRGVRQSGRCDKSSATTGATDNS